MKAHFVGMSLASAFAAATLLGSPLTALAQTDPAQPAGPEAAIGSKKVTLDVENANLYSALTLLFGQIHANFTLDPSLKQASVTAHLHSIPFATALDTLIKASGLPLSYQQENGVYSIVPKVADETVAPPESTMPEDLTPPKAKIKFKRLTGFTTNAQSIVGYFRTKGEVLQSTYLLQTGYGTGGLGGGQGGGFGGGGFGGQGGGFGGGGFGGQGGGFGGGGFGGQGGGFGGGGFGGGGNSFGGGGFGGGGNSFGGGGFGGGGNSFGGGGGGYGGGGRRF